MCAVLSVVLSDLLSCLSFSTLNSLSYSLLISCVASVLPFALSGWCFFNSSLYCRLYSSSVLTSLKYFISHDLLFIFLIIVYLPIIMVAVLSLALNTVIFLPITFKAWYSKYVTVLNIVVVPPKIKKCKVSWQFNRLYAFHVIFIM